VHDDPVPGGLVTAAVITRLRTWDVDYVADPRAALAVTLATQMDAGAGLAAATVAKQIDALLTALEPRDDEDDPAVAELRSPLVNAAVARKGNVRREGRAGR